MLKVTISACTVCCECLRKITSAQKKSNVSMTNSHGFGGMYVNLINELEKCILNEK